MVFGAWVFLRRVEAYRTAWRAHVAMTGGAPATQPGPFPIRIREVRPWRRGGSTGNARSISAAEPKGIFSELEGRMLKQPHGGELKNRYLKDAAPDEARRLARHAKSWDLAPRKLCDLELLLNGTFSPIEGFMGPAEYGSVLEDMRLPGGMLWPIPVTLDITEAFASTLEPGATIALRDCEGLIAATMKVGERWRPEKTEEARAVHGAHDDPHSGVSYLLHKTYPVCVSGRVSGIDPALHYDHRALRHPPAQLREHFHKLGWQRVVAFQTRNPLHRARVERTLQAARRARPASFFIPSWGVRHRGTSTASLACAVTRRFSRAFPVILRHPDLCGFLDLSFSVVRECRGVAFRLPNPA